MKSATGWIELMKAVELRYGDQHLCNMNCAWPVALLDVTTLEIIEKILVYDDDRRFKST